MGRVVEVKRTSDRLMTMELEVDGMLISIVSAYAPQVGCDYRGGARNFPTGG